MIIRKLFCLLSLLAVVSFGCSGKVADSPADDPDDSSNATDDDDDISSVFGSDHLPSITSALAAGLPDVMKTGGVTPSRNFSILEGIGLNDPIGSADMTPFPNTGNVLWLVWNLQYPMGEENCTEEEMTAGGCFRIHPSTGTDTWLYYKKPVPLDDPTLCRTEDGLSSESLGGSMVDTACTFEYTLMENGQQVDDCYESAGRTIDLNEYIPWITANWNVPADIKFQGAFGNSDEGYAGWFGVNSEVTGADGDYMVLQNDYQGGSIKLVYLDRVNNQFFVHATYAGQQEGFMTFQGELPSEEGGATSGAFEALQVLEYTEGSMAGEKFTIRMKSNGEHVWLQNWSYVPGDAEFDPSTPDSQNNDLDLCMKLESSLPESYYVDAQDCIDAFGVADIDALNSDSFYSLKLADIEKTGWFQIAPETFDPAVNPLTEETNTCFDE